MSRALDFLVAAPTEAQDHVAFVQWLRLRGLGDYDFHHSPNENASPAQYRRKLKNLGVSKGFPDLLIVRPTPCGRYRGMAIELKRVNKKNKPTPEQLHWLNSWARVGFLTVVCYGFDDAVKSVLAAGY